MKFDPMTSWCEAGVAAAAMLLLASGATAQSQTTQEPAAADTELPAAGTPQLAVEDKKIDQFAEAYIAVQEIQSEATQQLSATTDQQKAEDVKQAAETQMIKAVQRTGLQIEEFNQIVQAMAADATLRDRVSGRIDQRKRTT